MTAQSVQLSRMDPNDVVTLSSAPPFLPLDLIEEILCRLPVKLLLQLRCLCKSWNSLISDSKFAKKHLHMSKISQHQHRLITITQLERHSCELLLWDSPISSLFNPNPSTVTQTQLNPPMPWNMLIDRYGTDFKIISSCDGILCITIADRTVFLWNPSIRRFNVLPLLEKHHSRRVTPSCFRFSFGYDHFTHNYKVVALSYKNHQVYVHTLGTDYWTRIQDFPYSGPIRGPGVFVSGTVNWLAIDHRVIVSLDLEHGSYQELSQPDLDKDRWILGVLKDCLCIFASCHGFLDVWIMKEYGNKMSWTKLYSIPCMKEACGPHTKAFYISEDDQVLIDFCDLGCKLKLAVFNSKNDTWKIPMIQNINDRMHPEVYVESLILPC